MAIYENFVLENKITNLVNSNLDVRALMTIDDSLTVSAGLDKVINKYTYSGAVEKLAKGAKNTTKGAVTFASSKYTVNRYQQTFSYNDMDAEQDPQIVDVAAQGAAELMSNQIRTEYFAELAKISNKSEYDTFNYAAVCDALAAINKEVEDGMFIIMGSDLKASIRKDADFIASKQGEILYTGQFGAICGVPVLFSRLCPAGTAYITKQDAIKLFVKHDGRVEQNHDVETKDNTIVYDREGVMALVDDTYSITISKKVASAG